MTEQDRFENWYFPPARNQFMVEKNPDGTYVDSGTMFAWAAWQAAVSACASEIIITDGMAFAFHRALTDDASISSSELEEIKVGLRNALLNVGPPRQRVWRELSADAIWDVHDTLEDELNCSIPHFDEVVKAISTELRSKNGA